MKNNKPVNKPVTGIYESMIRSKDQSAEPLTYERLMKSHLEFMKRLRELPPVSNEPMFLVGSAKEAERFKKHYAEAMAQYEAARRTILSK